MKSILISIKPEWVAKILNGEKTIEIRKTMPKCELPIDVYIYCTKGDYIGRISKKYVGKVVARFTLRKAEKFFGIIRDGLCEEACLGRGKLLDYLGEKHGYAWHISDLGIYSEPKELSDFKTHKKNIVSTKINNEVFETELDNSLTKAPQSWCYVEEREDAK